MRNSKDYWFLYSTDIQKMANIYAMPEFKDKIQSSDYCPKVRYFFLIENDMRYQDSSMTVLEELMKSNMDDLFYYRAKEEDLDEFLSKYWDGDVNWDVDTYEIKKD